MDANTVTPARAARPVPRSEIEQWLVARIADIRGMNPENVRPDVAFAKYGLDSASAVALCGDLSDWLGRDLDPSVLYDFPSAAALAEHLAGAGEASGPAQDRAPGATA